MSDSPSAFDLAWVALRSQTDVGTFERRLDAAAPLYATVTNPGQLPGLMLRVDELPTFEASELRGSDRIEISTRQFESSAEISLRVSSAESTEMFSRLANDLSQYVLAAEDEFEQAAVFVRRFNRWQQFLRQTSSGPMSLLKQLGLYGELVTLRDVVLPAIGSLAAITSWTGPEKAPQDFQSGQLAIEVKSIAHSEPQVLRIDGERQLDDFGLDALILAHHRVFRQRGAGQTLPEMVSEIRSRLSESPVAIDQFDDKLFACGYLELDGTVAYEGYGYAVRESLHYRVKEGFPRLTESDLTAGVGGVTYSVSAAVCEAFEVQVSQIHSWLKSPESVVGAALPAESSVVEYKETAWTPVGDTKNEQHRLSVAKELQTSVVKTVVALMNSDGGELVIGVRDSDRAVTGIGVDLVERGKEADDHDAYELMIRELLRNQIDSLVSRQTRIQFRTSDEGASACHVVVAPSPNPRFGRPVEKEGSKSPVFWIRDGNSTSALAGPEILEYVARQWS